MNNMTYLDSAITCSSADAVQWGRAVLAVYGGAPQGPFKNRASACVDYIAHKRFTAEIDRVGTTIQQADSLWVQDRNGSKELAVTRALEAEDQQLEEQLFAAYIKGLAERSKTMRFKPSAARVPEYQDDETPALYE
ncbi:MAG: hypothetical protein JWO85_2473 [Candidatus Eremiobacteraeota bacterium]|nr:hypothetical protein [Candidatus Eremiobacteraeota bacterium]